MESSRLRIITLVLLGSLLLLRPLGADPSIDRFSNLRFLAMGSAGISSSYTEGAFYPNPAALFTSETTQFNVGMRYGESLGQQVGDPNPIPWIGRPTATFDLLFSNRYVALSIGLGNILIREEPIAPETYPLDRELYRANNLSRIQLIGSYGFKSISFGFFASGGTMTERDVEIRQERPFLDYLSRTYLERYESNADAGELFSSGIGMLINYPWISIGLLSNSLFTIDEATNQLTLGYTDIFRGAAIGMALTSPEFNQNNELNPVVINAVFDFVNLGDTQTRALRFGIEAKVQFLSNLWIALRGGYREERPVDESLFSITGTGEITSGLGGQVGNFGLDIVVEVPLTDDPVRVTAGMRWKI